MALVFFWFFLVFLVFLALVLARIRNWRLVFFWVFLVFFWLKLWPTFEIGNWFLGFFGFFLVSFGFFWDFLFFWHLILRLECHPKKNPKKTKKNKKNKKTQKKPKKTSRYTKIGKLAWFFLVFFGFFGVSTPPLTKCTDFHNFPLPCCYPQKSRDYFLRDGVGDGQLLAVKEQELRDIKTALSRLPKS